MNHGVCWVGVVVLSWLATAQAASLVQVGDAAIQVGSPIEWYITEADAAWLVSDVQRTPQLIITDAQQQQRTYASFVYQQGQRNPDPQGPREFIADGAVELRIRCTPRMVGLHQWILRDPAGQVLAQGEMTAQPSVGPTGPIRHSPYNPRLLAFADGTPFIPIGPNIAWALSERLANMERYFQKLSDNGGTHARVWMASWCGGVEGEQPDVYDLPQAWVTDEILRLARQYHIHLTVVIDNHYDLVHGKRSPYGATYEERARTFLAPTPGDQYLRKIRYVLARWGSDDTVACWELFNEVDMACVVREIAIPWINGATKAFRELDAEKRLLTISWAGSDWQTAYANADIDIVQLRGYVHEWLEVDQELRDQDRDGVGLLLANAAQANAGTRPFWFGEVGYQGLEQHNPGNEADVEGLLLRQQAWAGFMLGGCGPAMAWWWDVYIDHNNLWSVYKGLSIACSFVNWRDPGLVPVTPNLKGHLRVIGWHSSDQALLWPQIRVDTWHLYVVDHYERPVFPQPVGMQVPNFRPNTTYRIRWLHQISGAVNSDTTARTDAFGVLPLTMAADGHDLVVYIQVATPPAGVSP